MAQFAKDLPVLKGKFPYFRDSLEIWVNRVYWSLDPSYVVERLYQYFLKPGHAIDFESSIVLSRLMNHSHRPRNNSQ